MRAWPPNAGTPVLVNRRQRGGSDVVPTDAVFTIDDLVIYLKLPKSTVYELAQEGKISGQKVGRHWRFRKVVIDLQGFKHRFLCFPKTLRG